MILEKLQEGLELGKQLLGQLGIAISAVEIEHQHSAAGIEHIDRLAGLLQPRIELPQLLLGKAFLVDKGCRARRLGDDVRHERNRRRILRGDLGEEAIKLIQ